MSKPLMYGDISQIRVGEFVFWIEVGWVFISNGRTDRRLSFKWLADGGMVMWAMDVDNEPQELHFLQHDAPMLIELNSILFEKGVLGVTNKERYEEEETADEDE